MLMDIIRGILGLQTGPKDVFGNLDPNDVEGFWRADNDIDQAERAGNVQAAYARHGVKNEDQWDEVRGSFHRRHGHTPEYSLAASTANFKAQLVELQQRGADEGGYQPPAGFFDPVVGVGLDQYAIASVRTEGCNGPERQAVLSQLGLTPQQFDEAAQAWGQRISGNQDPIAGAMLGGLYHTYQAQVRAVYAR